MLIWLVEERSMRSDSKNIDCVNAYFASSEEKAREYCRTVEKYKSPNRDSWYWFAIFKVMIDSDEYCEEIGIMYDWNGKEIPKQPLEGYWKCKNGFQLTRYHDDCGFYGCWQLPDFTEKMYQEWFPERKDNLVTKKHDLSYLNRYTDHKIDLDYYDYKVEAFEIWEEI